MRLDIELLQRLGAPLGTLGTLGTVVMVFENGYAMLHRMYERVCKGATLNP
jgi:hypothetical protein